MTEAKQPESLRLADRLQNAVATYPQVSEDEPGGYCQEVDQVMDEAAAELRRQHAENATLQQGYDAARLEIEARNKQLVKEAARTAEEKLRADRMTEQHRMQCQMREGLEREIEALRVRQCLRKISEPSGWQPIETAPEGQMVVVGWFDPEDHDTPERHDFDSLEDGCWQKWHEHAEYVEVIGGHGVSYTAPYTSWMPVPAIPSTSSADEGGSNG